MKVDFSMASPAKGLNASASEISPRSGLSDFHNGSGQTNHNAVYRAYLRQVPPQNQEEFERDVAMEEANQER